MTQESVELWKEALLSGEYKQVDGRLRTGDEEGGFKYCCLGVACQISGLGTWRLDDADGEWYYEVRDKQGNLVDFSHENLPSAVRDWLGLSTNDGKYTPEENPDSKEPLTHGVLTDDNDNGLSFEDIVGIIDANPRGLFKTR